MKKICTIALLLSCLHVIMGHDEQATRSPRPTVNNPPQVVATDDPAERDVTVLRDVYVKGTVFVTGDLIASGTVLGGQSLQGLLSAPFMVAHTVESPLTIEASAGNQARLLFQENGVEHSRAYSNSGADGLRISVDGGVTSALAVAANNDMEVPSTLTVQSDLTVAQSINLPEFCTINNGASSFVVNFFDPASPTILDTLSVGGVTYGLGPCLALDTNAQFLYTFANGGDTVYKIDVSNPAAMSVADSFAPSPGHSVTALVYLSGYVYASVATVNRLYAINATTMTSPGFVPMTETAKGMVAGIVGGTPAVFATEDAASLVESFNVTNPAAMTQISSIGTIINPFSLALNGTTLFVDNPLNGGNGTLDSFDVAGLAFTPLDSVAYPTNLGYSVLATQGDFVYRASVDVESEIDVYEISSASFIAISDTTTQPSDLVIVDNYLYASAYALTNGYQVYSLSDPAAPIQLALIDLGDPSLHIAATQRYVFSKGGTITSLDNAQLIPEVALSVVGTTTMYGDLDVGRFGSALYVSSIYNSVGINMGTRIPGSNFTLEVNGSAHATSFPVSSDRNLKENIVPLSAMSSKLLGIEGVRFAWNEKHHSKRRSNKKREIGIIAQTVEEQFPELITYCSDPATHNVYRAVDYDRLTAILLTVANEHTAQLQAYRDEVSRLKERLEQLMKSEARCALRAPRAPRETVNDPALFIVQNEPVVRDVNVPRDMYVQGSVFAHGDLVVSGTVYAHADQQLPFAQRAPLTATNLASPVIVNADAGSASYAILQENGGEHSRFGSHVGSQDFFVSVDGGSTDALQIASNGEMTLQGPLTVQNDLHLTQSLHSAYCILTEPSAIGLSVIGTATVVGDFGVGITQTVLRVDTQNGRVGVNTAAPANPFALDVAGQLHATSFPVLSDALFKENIECLGSTVQQLSKIRGVSFEWGPAQRAMGRSTHKREIGVIAQEVEAQFPELITYWRDSATGTVYRAVDYDRLGIVIMNALNEHTRTLQHYEATIMALRERIQQCEARARVFSCLTTCAGFA